MSVVLRISGQSVIRHRHRKAHWSISRGGWAHRIIFFRACRQQDGQPEGYKYNVFPLSQSVGKLEFVVWHTLENNSTNV